ncbi:site-2 protease family protein [Dermatophilus congolensis]|nr:site-2 protease family protein [Dermatophilus congolensis]
MPRPTDTSGPAPSRPATAPHQRPSGAVFVGTMIGTPIYVGISWFLIAALLITTLGPQFARLVPGIGWASYAAALLYSLLLLASVMVHEFAHALLALRFGFRVDRVMADLMGGHTAYDAENITPGKQAAIAAVGPLANGLIALCGIALENIVTDPLALVLTGAVTWTNAFVAIFNLLPGIPLDGGHIVSALVWKATGKRTTGTRVAAHAGRLLVLAGIAALAYGIWTASPWGSLWNIAVAVVLSAYLWTAATQTLKTSKLLTQLENVDITTLLHPVRIMPIDAPLSEIPGRGPNENGNLPAVVIVTDTDGTPRGYLDPETVRMALEHSGPHTPASAGMKPTTNRWVLETQQHNLDAETIVIAMNEMDSPIVVLVENGTPFAVAEAGLIASALNNPSHRTQS